MRLVRLSSPYAALATAFDDVIGRKFFAQARRMFEHVVNLHRIAFTSAADLGCGTGLFARYLDSLWRVPVFGVDLSSAMLRRAAANCRHSGVRLLRQDIRRLRLPCRVDLVTANFDTVNHIVNDGELAELFRRVYAHLRPGGHLIFDFITPCDPVGGIAIHHRRSQDGRKSVTHRIRWTPANQLLHYEVFVGAPGRARRHLERHCERAYRPRDVAQWLMDAGFVLRDVLDAATLRRATRCPRRMLVVAQRAPD